MEPRRVGPYRLERQLGAGGTGVVHAAWDEWLERRVALKQIRPEAAGDPHRRERFAMLELLAAVSGLVPRAGTA